MRIQQRTGHLGTGWPLLLVVVLAAPGRVRGAEPQETICAAFRAASQGITSGTGKGTYRHYEAIAGGDWQLKQDADLTTYFDGKKYHIELQYHRDEVTKVKVDSRRIVFDGKVVTEAMFAPTINPTGAMGRLCQPEDFGSGVSRPSEAGFPWDVALLVGNIWHPERVIKNVAPQRIEIRQTPGGDLVGSYPLGSTDRVRVQFECPRDSGFNLARMQVFNVAQAEPAEDARIEWKQSPTGLWYVRSIDKKAVFRDPRIPVARIRNVLKYTEFQPNASVDPKLFMEPALGLPSRSPILDWRPGTKAPFRQAP
jgi:hypothetical protein